MTVLAWVKAKVFKRKHRSVFGNRKRSDGREEYIIKIPGWSGELRKYMTESEAEEWVIDTNKEAFCEAAEASKYNLFGAEEFTANGKPMSHIYRTLGKMAAKGFGTKPVDKE